MDRKTRRTSKVSSSSSVAPASELAVVKAAARAWYKHGSVGSAARAPRRSSRCRLEFPAVAESSAAEPVGPAIPLLDAYEIEWITRELDRLLAASTSSSGDGGHQGKRRETTAAAAVEKEEEERRRRRAAPRTKAGGFWVRHAVGVCSPKGAAAEPVVARRRRAPPAAVV